MGRHYYLNEDHSYTPCDLMTWAMQLEELWEARKKHVAVDIIEGKRISTVWLGLDHSYDGRKPLLFETMIFADDEIGGDIYMDRYTTWEEAEAGHQKAIQWVKDGCIDS